VSFIAPTAARINIERLAIQARYVMQKKGDEA
jgi:hypothetical protein